MIKGMIHYCCLTDPGHLREVNQDSFICRYAIHNSGVQSERVQGSVLRGNQTVLAVFDGMGGIDKGEIAAELAAKELIHFDSHNDPIQALKDYCSTANRRIVDYSDMYVLNMGTTAAILMFDEKAVYLCNIGDTRIYRYSEEHLEQISKDHIVQDNSGNKPCLSQNLGIPEGLLTIDPYISKFDYSASDRYLICTDGLTDMVSESVIERIMRNSSLSEAGEKLIAEALKNGGIDNVTVLICEIE